MTPLQLHWSVEKALTMPALPPGYRTVLVHARSKKATRLFKEIIRTPVEEPI